MDDERKNKHYYFGYHMFMFRGFFHNIITGVGQSDCEGVIIVNNYARLNRGKLKAGKSIEDAYKHNERIFSVDNADPLRKDLNIEVVDCNGLTYQELVDQTLDELRIAGVPPRTVRKDAVLGFELVLGFSREMEKSIDLDKWIDANIAWVNETYNPPNNEVSFKDAETGEEKKVHVQNIKHAIVHRDESNTHMHVFIVPIDDKGNLNSKYYNQERSALVQQQTDYAKAMEQFGLVRGEQHSTAKAETITKYYNNINKAVLSELPEPEIGETIQDYHKRVNEVYQVELSHHNNDVVKLKQELIHERSVNTSEKIRLHKEEADLANAMRQIKKEIGRESIDDDLIRDLSSSYMENKRFKKAVDEFPIRPVAEETERQFNNLVQWQLERELQQEQNRANENKR